MFRLDGYSTLQILQSQHRYQITTAYDRYSFIVDDTELNPMGKLGIQTQLVSQHFNLTKKLTNLILGYTNFTDLPETPRRDWAMLMSKIDYNYLTDLYTKAKKDLTYAKNVIRHQTEVLEGLEVPNVDTLRVELEELVDYAEVLGKIDYRSVDVMALKRKAEGVEERISALNDLVHTDIPEGIDELYRSSQVEYGRVSTETKVLEAQTLELEKALHLSVSNVELDKMLINKEELEKTQKLLPKWEYSNTPKECYKVVITKGEELGDYYGLELGGRNTLEEALSKNAKNLSQHHCTLQSLKAKETLISSLERALTRCPACGENFTTLKNHEKPPNSDGKSIEQLKKEVRLTNQTLGEIKLLPDEILADFTEQLARRDWYDALRKYSFPWDKINCSVGYGKLIRALESEKERVRISGRIEQISKQIELVNSLDSSVLDKIKSDYSKTEEKLRKSTINKQKMKIIMEKFEGDIKERNKLISYAQDYSLTLGERLSLRNEIMWAIRMQNAAREANETETRLLKISALINHSEVRKKEIKTIENTINRMQIERDALLVLVKTLSPQFGIISHTLREFQGHFVQKVNNYLKNIWTKELTVFPPKKKQFYGLKCNSDSEDIKESSDGMQEIINLAFRLAIQKQLLPDFPLFIDEVGVKLDEKHRTAMYDYINQTLFNDYPNVFMVSHYKELYSIFDRGTEFVVINSDNIDTTLIPCEINTGLTYL